MNIKEAKTQIRNAMTAYFTRDTFGDYVVPIERQRAVFMIGAPGIGKTAIMAQIAEELGVALVSYSMTHHTRQSALGLPFIVKKQYGGAEYVVSEYTMSEIIASVYDAMEATGLDQGILFLDEINCVSETLAPAMLQFLQYKIFGRHSVPDGWIVVAAGNPPEYNRSVREFDIVTWDRLKRVDVEPDFDAWKEYAYETGVHPAIMTYLEIKKGDFFKVESVAGGKRFVTPRGWHDLSQMLHLYEGREITIDEAVVGQYLQDPKIAKDFAVYYDLFNKYKSDYQVDKILVGKVSDEIKERAGKAQFDERLSLLGLLLGAIGDEIRETMKEQEYLHELLAVLKDVKNGVNRQGRQPGVMLGEYAQHVRQRMEHSEKASTLSVESRQQIRRLQEDLRSLQSLEGLERAQDGKSGFRLIKSEFDARVDRLTGSAGTVSGRLSNVFRFVEDAFGAGQEVLILVTELTMNPHSARFISAYGCDEYFRHNKELLFYERQREIITRLDAIDMSLAEEDV
ncbi:MAG: AAA family ATPase [Armatimonadetes bacterium]|nr:AAA family ATPase [Armatimonadota bacterium]